MVDRNQKLVHRAMMLVEFCRHVIKINVLILQHMNK